MKLVFMLEEASTKEVLDILLPKILPSNIRFQTIKHSGKSDLRKSIPRKITGWTEPDVKFIIIHDQDACDCVELKNEIRELCPASEHEILIRIACREMEAWYFGDLKALSKAYSKDFTSLARRRKYRVPDDMGNPKEELRALIPAHQQIHGARIIAQYMNPYANTSRSFNALVAGIERVCRISR